MRHGPHFDPLRLLNRMRTDDLLAAARAFGGHPDATSARAERVDGGGIDLVIQTPHGRTSARVAFGQRVPDGDTDALRAAFHDLSGRAHATLAEARGRPSAPR